MKLILTISTIFMVLAGVVGGKDAWTAYKDNTMSAIYEDHSEEINIDRERPGRWGVSKSIYMDGFSRAPLDYASFDHLDEDSDLMHVMLGEDIVPLRRRETHRDEHAF